MDARVLADRFDQQRRRLRRTAYRILGSLTEADDAVQEAWIRLQRADVAAIDNLDAWLTTVVARICLNALRARATRREEPLQALVPEPIVTPDPGTDPEHQALIADAVGIALQVVLQTLPPAERVAYVLHDMFSVPFDEISELVERSPQAARQLASRARRRVREAAPIPEPDVDRQRAVVEAFFAASRHGDLEALVAVLDPDVVIRSHTRTGVVELRGARKVAGGALTWRSYAGAVRPALINGVAGVVAYDGERPFALLAFTVIDDRAVAIDVFNDRELVPGLVHRP